MTIWRSDWEHAPKDQKPFLVKLEEGKVTTAYHYWYTEDDHEVFKPIKYWALQDANTDMPLDEQGPPAMQGYLWAEIPA